MTKFSNVAPILKNPVEAKLDGWMMPLESRIRQMTCKFSSLWPAEVN
jgi:hypothetical protein